MFLWLGQSLSQGKQQQQQPLLCVNCFSKFIFLKSINLCFSWHRNGQWGTPLITLAGLSASVTSSSNCCCCERMCTDCLFDQRKILKFFAPAVFAHFILLDFKTPSIWGERERRVHTGTNWLAHTQAMRESNRAEMASLTLQQIERVACRRPWSKLIDLLTISPHTSYWSPWDVIRRWSEDPQSLSNQFQQCSTASVMAANC